LAIALVLLGTTFAQITSLSMMELAIAGGVHGITDLNDLAAWSEVALTHTGNPGELLIDGEVNDEYIENTAAWLDDVYPWFDVEIPTVTSSDGSTTYDTNGIDDEYFYFNGGQVRDSVYLSSSDGKSATLFARGSDSTNTRADVTMHATDMTGAYPNVGSIYFSELTETSAVMSGMMVSFCGFSVSIAGSSVFSSDETGSWTSLGAENTDDDFYTASYMGASPFAAVWTNSFTESFYDGDVTVNSNELRFDMLIPAALVATLSAMNPTAFDSDISICFGGSGFYMDTSSIEEVETGVTEKKENDIVVGWTYADATNTYRSYFSPDRVAKVDRGNITDVAVTFSSLAEGLMTLTFPLSTNEAGDVTIGGAIGIYKEPIVTPDSSSSGSSSGSTASTGSTASGSSFTSLSFFAGVLATLIALLFN